MPHRRPTARIRPTLVAGVMLLVAAATPRHAWADPPVAEPQQPATGSTPPAAEPAPPAAQPAVAVTVTVTTPPRPPAARRWPLSWDPTRPRIGVADYVIAGVGATGILVDQIAFQGHAPTLHWSDPILFDVAARNALVGTTVGVRDTANAVSTYMLYGMLAYPILVDVPVAYARGGLDLAWQLLAQDAVAFAVAAMVDLVTRDLVGRARPFTYACLQSGGTDCLADSESTRSFPGGHFALTTTAAALICTQHLGLHLYGGVADAITCGTALAADATVGVLRMVADYHWASDIIIGGLVGALSGWGLPTLMHYRHVVRPPTHAGGIHLGLVVPVPMVTTTSAGVGLAGLFD